MWIQQLGEVCYHRLLSDTDRQTVCGVRITEAIGYSVRPPTPNMICPDCLRLQWEAWIAAVDLQQKALTELQ